MSEAEQPWWTFALLACGALAAVGVVAFVLLHPRKADENRFVSFSPTVSPSPTVARKTAASTVTSTPTPALKMHSAAEALVMIKAIYDDPQASYNKYRTSFTADYAAPLVNQGLNYDSMLCAQSWPPSGGVTYGAPSQPDQAHLSTVDIFQHWNKSAQPTKVSVVINTDQLKIARVECAP